MRPFSVSQRRMKSERASTSPSIERYRLRSCIGRVHQPAEAGPDRIDEDEVGEVEPGLRIGHEPGGLRGHDAVAFHRQPPGPERAKVQIGGSGTRSAVHDEGDRARRRIVARQGVGDEADIRLRPVLARHEGDRPGRGGEGETAPVERKLVPRRPGRGKPLLADVAPGGSACLCASAEAAGASGGLASAKVGAPFKIAGSMAASISATRRWRDGKVRAEGLDGGIDGSGRFAGAHCAGDRSEDRMTNSFGHRATRRWSVGHAERPKMAAAPAPEPGPPWPSSGRGEVRGSAAAAPPRRTRNMPAPSAFRASSSAALPGPSAGA